MSEETYYARNRERLLARAKEYNKRPEVILYQRNYQREYYQKHRSVEARERKIKEEPVKKPDMRGKSTHKRTGGKGARPPKAVWLTSKLDSEEQVYGMTSYKYSNIVKNCPQGFYQRPEGENPFLVSFQ